jgi:hypothetical protein
MSHSTFIGLLGLMTMIEQQTAVLNGLYPMHSVTSFGQETDQPNSDGGDAESYPSWEYHQSGGGQCRHQLCREKQGTPVCCSPVSPQLTPGRLLTFLLAAWAPGSELD